jgi:hypothetical protein
VANFSLFSRNLTEKPVPPQTGSEFTIHAPGLCSLGSQIVSQSLINM